MALHLDLLHLEVGDGGQELGVPVDEALVLVDEALLVKLHEDLEDRLRQALIHGEALARPVAGSPQPAQLARNRAAGFLLPRPHPLQERLAPHGAAVGLVLLCQKPLNHHLRGNAGMVGARLPQDIAPPHALEAAQDILDGVVEGVAHVQRTRHVGWRDHDGEGLCVRAAAGLEGTGFLPFIVKPRLDGRGVVMFVEHDRIFSWRTTGAAV